MPLADPVTQYVPMVGESPTTATFDPVSDDRIQQLLDERDIVRLMTRYADRIDANDPVGSAACFATDGVGDYWGEHQGREAIAARLAGILDAFSCTSHHLTNWLID